MQNPKTKPKFQSTEDYLKDYEAYKKGYKYKYKVLYAAAGNNYKYNSLYLRFISDIFKERLNPTGVVDLTLKFRNIL